MKKTLLIALLAVSSIPVLWMTAQPAPEAAAAPPESETKYTYRTVAVYPASHGPGSSVNTDFSIGSQWEFLSVSTTGESSPLVIYSFRKVAD